MLRVTDIDIGIEFPADINYTRIVTIAKAKFRLKLYYTGDTVKRNVLRHGKNFDILKNYSYL